MVLLLLLFFILGAVTVVAAQAAGVWILISRPKVKPQKQEAEAKAVRSVASPSDVNACLCDKQGDLWVLEPEKVPKLGVEDKTLTEQRKRKEILEVAPVCKHARIKDRCLILTEMDGTSVEISLRGCMVVAVSATDLSTRKWAKRYPIKVVRKDSVIYKGHKVIYIYLETSWEKESWCKALRLASFIDERKTAWFSKWSTEFQNYLESLNAGYPSFMKPDGFFGADIMDKSVKFDNSSSKVRQFLKKLGRKASKGGYDYKASGIQNLGHEDKKLSESSRSIQDSTPNTGLGKIITTGKPLGAISADDSGVASSVSTSSEPGSRSNLSGTSDGDSDHNEGALCFNLLLSRLFFDAKNNPLMVSSIQNHIQRGLSNMRIPAYIGGITCTALDPGTLPPRMLAMRVLPSDMNEVWAMEIDVEYLGGAILDIETRLEIQELDLEIKEGSRIDTNTASEVASDLLEDLGEQLKLSDETMDERKQKDEGDCVPDEKETSKSIAGTSSQVPRWKSVLHSITKQFSQVPITLGIRISSLRGTLRLSMKPPPSDQIWLTFSSMPDIEFNLESYVGDRKITSGHLALFLINRFKAGIRETMVLPNRESVSIPWMLAEKDDWVPRKVAPFMWYRSNQDTTCNTMKRANSIRTSEAGIEKSKSFGHTAPPSPSRSSLGSVIESPVNNGSPEDLQAPLLEKDDVSLSGREDKVDSPVHSRSLVSTEGQTHSSEDDESKLRRLGTRERMHGLGKRMGEKLEVKRRNIEEKGRILVERMRKEGFQSNG